MQSVKDNIRFWAKKMLSGLFILACILLALVVLLFNDWWPEACGQAKLDSLPVFSGANVIDPLDGYAVNGMGNGRGEYEVRASIEDVQSFYEGFGANCWAEGSENVRCEYSEDDFDYEVSLVNVPRGTRVQLFYNWSCSLIDLVF